jgi:hypothetical protein
MPLGTFKAFTQSKYPDALLVLVSICLLFLSLCCLNTAQPQMYLAWFELFQQHRCKKFLMGKKLSGSESKDLIFLLYSLLFQAQKQEREK